LAVVGREDSERRRDGVMVKRQECKFSLFIGRWKDPHTSKLHRRIMKTG
jgi:hypothetical protein